MNGKHLGPKPLLTREQELAVCDYYWTRQPNGFYPSYQEVASVFNCSAGHVRNMLKKHDYQTRTQAETREHRPCKAPYSRGEAPLCACGCGTPVAWDTGNERWQKYTQGHYRPKQAYHDAEWLRAEYVEKQRTLTEIAGQFGVEVSTIVKAMKKCGITRRSTSESLVARGTAVGANNPAWKGGVAKWEYASDWKRLCKQIKDRDKWTCQLCGEQRKRWGHKLHVHHIDGDKRNNHPHNLISLCVKCHAPVHADTSARLRLLEIARQNSGD